jgi:hypothetical protein
VKDPVYHDAILNLVMDIEYLNEMKKLEENPMSEGGLKLGVVPISGTREVACRLAWIDTMQE